MTAMPLSGTIRDFVSYLINAVGEFPLTYSIQPIDVDSVFRCWGKEPALSRWLPQLLSRVLGCKTGRSCKMQKFKRSEGILN